MSILNQKTIKEKITINGIGLHTGQRAQINLIPSAPNTGITFKRTDLNKNNLITPTFDNVTETNLCTTLSNEHGIKVSTIEHLMGAFYGLGVDNAIVELDSQELPIIDGSAKKFVELILKAGFRNYDDPIKLIKIDVAAGSNIDTDEWRPGLKCSPILPGRAGPPGRPPDSRLAIATGARASGRDGDRSGP